MTCMLACIAPSVPFLTQQLIDHHILANAPERLNKTLILIAGILLMQGFLQYTHTRIVNFLGQTCVRDLRNRIFTHILGLRSSYFDRTPVGLLHTRVVSDTEVIAEIFEVDTITIFGDFLQLLAVLSIMFYTDWKLSLVCLITYPFLFFAMWIFKEKTKITFREVRRQVGRLNTFLQEHITGIITIQLFNQEKTSLKNFGAINKDHRDANIKTIRYYSIFFPVVEILAATSVALTVWYGAGRVVQDQISLGVLVAFLMYLNLAFRPVRMLADKFNTLQRGIVSTERIFRVLNTHEYIEDNGKIMYPIRGKIEFSHVSFSYEPRQGPSELPHGETGRQTVLDDISFHIEAGKSLAVIGATGAGKTTLASLICRFYEPDKGRILIDENDIHKYSLRHLQTNIAFIQQDVFLFSGTILDNIRLFNEDLSLLRIRETAGRLGVDEYIQHLPGGYESEVYERGLNFSSGQRQLISFLRAFINAPPIVILDEATSNMDTETERILQNAMFRLLEGRTALIIAHRLSTIRNADRILVLDKGKISEVGTHEGLIRAGGIYQKLSRYSFPGRTEFSGEPTRGDT